MNLLDVTGRKIRIRHGASGRVIVLQDGDAPDPIADEVHNDFFENGIQLPGRPADSLDNVRLRGLRMRATHRGKELSFRIQDYTNWNLLRLAPNSRVEFWGDQADTWTGQFPSWHSAEQGEGQVLHFVGFIEEVARVHDSEGTSEFEISCVDSLRWMDEIILQRSKGDSRDIPIPTLVFNVEDMGDPDWHIAVKGFDRTQPTPVQQFGTGNPQDPAQAVMSLTDILTYLQDAYRVDLFERGLGESAPRA